ncbi:hypothetical protein [Paenibacillus sp. An7]|uniref:hypothetical protein n=1 Tax=Paenibacillus sp. An7 TaxID=2689577 RepID=UPI001356E483|nr:hypothetical protein [Paenibacillus sp. An7]
MNNKFTFLLLGPAGSGKSTFLAGFSKLSIFDYVAAQTFGGANTTKVSTTYEFIKNSNSLAITECITTDPDDKKQILKELNDLIIEEHGIIRLFQKINSDEFSKKCLSITIQLPAREGIFSGSSRFDTIVIRDSRGFGDVGDNNSFELEKLNVTYDVNAILFFSISSIQQPIIFKEIIDKIMETNLKTPMFLLRRDIDLTKNDEKFESEILENILKSDKDLHSIISEVGKHKQEWRLNNFVFNLPEVKKWKGAINVEDQSHNRQIKDYNNASKQVLEHAFSMYDKLYEVILKKMQGELQGIFTSTILNNLLTVHSLEIVQNIATQPYTKPHADYYIDRDTAALANPVQLYDSSVNEEIPFVNEVNKRGNRYADGVIPSYSYSCVNFRSVFQDIVRKLTDCSNSKNLFSLFSTFMDIVLKDYTITTYTGYTFADSRQNAFKFNLFLEVRDKATETLKEVGLVKDTGEWKSFDYTINGQRYTESAAICVLMYKCLIDALNLEQQFNKLKILDIEGESLKYLEINQKDKIQNKIARK